MAAHTRGVGVVYGATSVAACVDGLTPSLLACVSNGVTQVKPPPKTLTFGTTFSDHMLEADWNFESGWAAPVISKYHNLSISPAASSLHYALQVCRVWV